MYLKSVGEVSSDSKRAPASRAENFRGRFQSNFKNPALTCKTNTVVIFTTSTSNDTHTYIHISCRPTELSKIVCKEKL